MICTTDHDPYNGLRHGRAAAAGRGPAARRAALSLCDWRRLSLRSDCRPAAAAMPRPRAESESVTRSAGALRLPLCLPRSSNGRADTGAPTRRCSSADRRPRRRRRCRRRRRADGSADTGAPTRRCSSAGRRPRRRRGIRPALRAPSLAPKELREDPRAFPGALTEGP